MFWDFLVPKTRFCLSYLLSSRFTQKCRIVLWSKVLARWCPAALDFLDRLGTRPLLTLLLPPDVVLYSKPKKSLGLVREFRGSEGSLVPGVAIRIWKVMAIPKTSRMAFGWNGLVLKLQLRVEFYSILVVSGHLHKQGRTEGTAGAKLPKNGFTGRQWSVLNKIDE